MNKLALTREVVGKIITSQGEFTMVLLELRDVLDIYSQKNMDAMEQTMRVVARSIGVNGDEFLTWNIPDAMKVMEKYTEVNKKL